VSPVELRLLRPVSDIIQMLASNPGKLLTDICRELVAGAVQCCEVVGNFGEVVVGRFEAVVDSIETVVNGAEKLLTLD
jgi:hypothetical protein